MATPYDGKILLVNWQGATTPGATADELAALIRKKMPNVAGVMLKTSNGVSWQGLLGGGDNDPKAITGITRIQEWVAAFTAHNLEIHVWGVPRAKRPAGENVSPDIANEAKKFISAANVSGVKSLLLDVEEGDYYWLGSPGEARDLMTQIRAGVPAGTHIGLILDGRRNRPFDFYVEPWLRFVDSLHPMVYPILFDGYKTIEQHLDEAFQNLAAYDKPIVPMLQAFGEAGRRPTPEEVTQQGNAAFARNAAGLSYFRLSSDAWGDGQPHMGEPEYAAIAAVTLPGKTPRPAYTWQMVTNAVYIVATRAGADYSEWLDTVGFWTLFNDSLRGQPYSGAAIAAWPLPADQRAEILNLLQRTAAELAQLATQVANEKEHADKNNAAEQRKLYGSMVGIHGAPGCAAPPLDKQEVWINYLKEMGVKWYKQCDDGQPAILDWARRLKQEGIEPIIRYLVTEQFPDRLPDLSFARMQQYVEAQIVWAEIGNEPNLDMEWQAAWRDRLDRPVSHTNPEAIRRIAETWLADAQRALAIGARPAFYAFAPTDWHGGSHPQYSSVFFTQKVVAYLAQHHHDETVAAFQQGAWIAVHAATYEQPVGLDPFAQGGAIWDMTLRSYEVVLKAFRDNFGADLDMDEIVVMSTEGGVFTPDSTSMSGHDRLHTNEEHAQRVVEMFRWLERNSPLQAMCPWCLSVGSLIGHFNDNFRFDGWIEEINGEPRPRPVYEALRQLRFDHAREEENLGKTLNPVKLAVPYISQFDPGASTHSGDCGPACVAMILNAEPNGRNCTVDQLYAHHLPDKPAGEFTKIGEVIVISTAEGVPMQRVELPDRDQALARLRELVQQNTPFVVLVNYAKWDAITNNNFKGGHFVVVTGCDDQNVFVHDPIFRGPRRNQGEHFVWRNEKFLEAWGSCHENDGNPDFVALVPGKQVARV